MRNMWKCSICNKIISQLRNFNRHMKNIHGILVKTAPRSKSNTQKSKYRCLECHCVFIDKSSLTRHVKIKHDLHTTPAENLEYASCEFIQSNLADYPLLENSVPGNYLYKVNSLENLEDGKFKAKFEIAHLTKEEFFVWLLELSQKSLVTFKVKSFNKSINPKVVFNKVFRCVHNTFPRKISSPHRKHTGCLATLTVRVQKCREYLSTINTNADDVTMISLKGIITLNHCHNHPFGNSLPSCQIKKEENTNNDVHSNDNLTNQLKSDNSLNQVNFLHPNNQISTLSNSLLSFKTMSDANLITFENRISLYEYQYNSFPSNDNIQEMCVDCDNLESLEEFNDYIVEDNKKIDNFYNDDDFDEMELKILNNYDTLNEKMVQCFKSNPKYFLSAIEAFTLTMKNSLTCKESLLNALHSFGSLL